MMPRMASLLMVFAYVLTVCEAGRKKAPPPPPPPSMWSTPVAIAWAAWFTVIAGMVMILPKGN